MGGMSLAALRERLVREGITAARETRYPSHAEEKRRGAVRGFEGCLDLATPEQYAEVIGRLRSECEEMSRRWRPVCDLREKRHELLQVEYVFEVLKVHWGIFPQSVRAVARYALVSRAGEARGRGGNRGGSGDG